MDGGVAGALRRRDTVQPPGTDGMAQLASSARGNGAHTHRGIVVVVRVHAPRVQVADLLEAAVARRVHELVLVRLRLDVAAVPAHLG